MTGIPRSERPRYSLVFGRFQPLHLGHLEYLEAARKRADCLVIGVTNPNIGTLIHDDADPGRSRPDSNPFPYFDRHQMIAAALIDAGWSCHDFAIVPAPINSPAEMASFLPAPELTLACITVYDQWGDRKIDLVSNLGYEVEVLWRRGSASRLTSGTKIRDAMRTGGDWRSFVPAAVARYLDDSGWTAALQGGPPR